MPTASPSGLREEGRREEALAALKAALRADPKDAAALAIQGEVLRELGARRRGYDDVRRSLTLDPTGGYAERFVGAKAGRGEAWAYACRAGARRGKGDLDGARSDLARALALDSGCGWIWGWLGELELMGDKPEAAVVALDKAVGLFGEWPEAYGWRGEALRRLGRFGEALCDLDHSVALGYRDYTVFLSRALVHEANGDADGHLRELAAAVRANPDVFRAQAKQGDASAGKWIESVLAEAAAARKNLKAAEKALEGGDAKKAEALLQKALKSDPALGEAHRLLADIAAQGQRADEAMERADAAVKLDPSSDSYAKRAFLAQRFGYMEAALRDVSIAAALGPSASLFQWRARQFLGMRHYDLALRDITAALAVEPDNADLFDLRAHVNLVLARLDEAQTDLERALKALPKHVNLHLRLAQLLALRGQFKEARDSLAPIEKASPAWANFARGYVSCVNKEYARADEEFAKARKLATDRDGRLAMEAGFFGVVAKAFGGLPKEERDMAKKGSPKEKGKVYLCGLGVYPPQTATVEVLRGISECDVVFNNLPGLGMSEFLGLFCANRRPVAFRYEQDAKLCADLVLSEVKPGRTVGFVTFGHPLLFGPLSHEIIQRCAKEGIPCKAFGAVSSMDAVLAASGQVLGYSYGGFQMFETTGKTILKEIPSANPRLPVVVYFAEGLGDAGLKTLIEMLGKLYSPAHKVLLYGPKHELWETQQEGTTLRELANMSHHKLAQGILFVPPKN